MMLPDENEELLAREPWQEVVWLVVMAGIIIILLYLAGAR